MSASVEYVLVSDMDGHNHPQYGECYFCTPDVIRSDDGLVDAVTDALFGYFEREVGNEGGEASAFTREAMAVITPFIAKSAVTDKDIIDALPDSTIY